MNCTHQDQFEYIVVGLYGFVGTPVEMCEHCAQIESDSPEVMEVLDVCRGEHCDKPAETSGLCPRCFVQEASA